MATCSDASFMIVHLSLLCYKVINVKKRKGINSKCFASLVPSRPIFHLIDNLQCKKSCLRMINHKSKLADYQTNFWNFSHL